MRRFSLLVAALVAALLLLAAPCAFAAGTQLAGTATAGSAKTVNPARYMNDGNTSSYWLASSTAVPQLVTIDLGEPKVLSASDVAWKVKGAVGFRIYGSNDGALWYELSNQDGNRVKTTHTVVSGTYRYVRMRINSLSSGSAGIYEWKLYGSDIATPTATATASPTPAPTATPTVAPTATVAPTPTPTATVPPSPTPTATPTVAPSPSASPTVAPSPSATPTAAPTPSASPAPAGGVNVMSYGARADGVSDDSAAILAAVKAAAGKDVYLPAGTYKLASTLVVPAGARLAGAGLGSTWVKGRIDFNSNSSFTDMKIGDAGKAAVHNATATTSGTSFTRVQFRGGGGAKYIDSQVVSLYSAGDTTAVSDLTFSDCNIECNLGVEDATHSKHFDNVYIAPSVVAPSVDNVLFRGCRFGVSNGVRSGSPRFNVEIYANSYAATRTHGFQNINFEDCVFEGADDENLDYSGSTLSSSPTTPNDGYSHVTGCTFKGNGKVGVWYGDLIVEAGAGYIEIVGNTFYRGAGQAIAVGGNGASGVDTACTIRDNVVDPRDAASDTGVTHTAFEYVKLMSNANTLSANTIVNSSQYRRALTVSGDRNTISGNTLINAPSGGNVVGLESASSLNALTANVLTGGGIYDVGTSNRVN